MAILEDPFNLKWRRKHGAVVGQKNRPIAGARRLVRPTNRRHSKQQIFRVQVNSLVEAWYALNEGERLAWGIFAGLNSITNKYGDPEFITGYNWFFRLNKTLASVGSNFLSVPPGSPNPTYDPVFSVFQPAGTNNLAVDAFPPVTGGNKFYVHRSLNVSTGTFWPPKPLASYRSFDNSDSDPFVIAFEENLYPGKFKSWFQFSPSDFAGRSSTPTFWSNVSIHLSI